VSLNAEPRQVDTDLAAGRSRTVTVRFARAEGLTPARVALADLPQAGRAIVLALLEAESAAACNKAAPSSIRTLGAATTRTDRHAASA
jgi:hypothetical protein